MRRLTATALRNAYDIDGTLHARRYVVLAEEAAIGASVGRMMNVGLDHRGVDPQLGAVFQTKRDRGLNHQMSMQGSAVQWLGKRRRGHSSGRCL